MRSSIETLQDFATDRKNKLWQEYLNSPNYIIEHYRSEGEAIEEYDGRQLLEMLQNADDASAVAKEPKALVKLIGDQLIIANTGHSFTEEGLESILYRNISPKFREHFVIGNKGLGFRSILSWINKVSIYSGDLCVAFSEKFSQNFLYDLISEKPSIKDLITKKNKGFEPIISILRVPEVLDTRPKNLPEGYDTYIVLDLKKEVLEDVKAQIISAVNEKSLIFINHLQEVKLEINEHSRILTAKRESDYILINEVSDGKKLTQKWCIHSVNGEIEKTVKGRKEKHFFKLSVAWNPNELKTHHHLYSYFKTMVPFEFPGLLHGTFELTPDRNKLLNKSKFNDELIQKIPKLLCDASLKIASQNSINVNYNALSFLNVNFDSLDTKFKENNFKDELIETIKRSEIFPTINEKYIDFNEEPVFFENEILANTLHQDTFNDVLKYISFEEVNYTLDGSLEYYDYNISDFIRKVTSDYKYYSRGDYANIILGIDELYLNIPKSIPPLFYNKEFSLLNFDNQVFIPDNKDFIQSTEGLQVQVISEELFSKISNFLSESELEKFVERFHLSRFTINEVIELIISNFKEKIDLQSSIELNKRLFYLFIKYEKDLTSSWEGTAIPSITLKGKVANANTLYFSKEYQEPLSHELFKFNRNKIIASPAKFNIEVEQIKKWKDFLIWAGVVAIPRRIQNTVIDKDYAYHCLKLHNYKRKLDDKNFKNYDDLRSSLNGFGKIKVLTIDCLEEILLNNTTETIISWLFIDDQLKNLLEKDIEPNSSSIELDFYKTKYYRRFYGPELKNYVKWFLNKLTWLETNDGTKQSPNNCTTATNINDDFKGILDKPEINYEHPFFKKYAIKKNQIEYILHCIGVHESIATLSTSSLYNILLQLPLIDKEGKKVKTIYREIATNFEIESLDLNDKTYHKYLEEGKVFCETKDHTEDYLPIPEVYYVDNKRYGGSVISLFNRIAIDRRKGKTKIKTLFGVKALEKLNISIIGEVQIHPLNALFENEIQQFKPYVYVLRQDYDKKGADRNRIKNIKFKLVKKLDVSIKKGKTDYQTKLDDYEYYNDTSKNEILIVLPKYITTIEEAKNDVPFCSAIAESFSSLLDVDQQRNQIRELFSKNIIGRNQILADELDDSNTEKLQKAKESLQIISNYKIDFWLSFLRCFPRKKVKDVRSDKELHKELEKIFSKSDFEFLKSKSEEINYLDFNTLPSLYTIIEIFNRFKINLSNINNFIYPSVSLSLVYQEHFELLKQEYRSSFRELLYKRLKSEAKLRSAFNSYLEDYDLMKYSGDVNDLDYSSKVENYLKEFCLKDFGITLIKIKNNIDLNLIYKENKKKLYTITGVTNQMFDLFREDFPDIDSQLFFREEIKTIADSLELYIVKVQADNSGKAESKNNIKLNGKEIFFDTYEDLIQNFSEKISKDSTKKWKFESISTRTSNSNSSLSSSKKTKTGKRKNYNRNKHIGFLAEYFVWEYLKLNVAKADTVEWVSEYAREAGINPLGRDGFGYDIKYVPKTAKTPRYVEVKAIGWDGSFNISSNEVQEAESLKNKHELFLVSDIENLDNIKIARIQGMFTYEKGSHFYDNQKFSVLNDNFIIKYTVDKKS